MALRANFTPRSYNVSPYICKTCLRRRRGPFPTRNNRNLYASPALDQTTTSPAPTSPPASPHQRPKIGIPLQALSLRWGNPRPPEPTADQLTAANRFFTKHPPTHLWSAAKFRTIALPKGSAPSKDTDNGVSSTSPTPTPEIAFLGRSNTGKSTLLNAILHASLCHTSSKPGRTRTMNAYSVCQGRLTILDMPGYGKGSRPEWGTEIMKYLTSRKQLRHTYLLLDPTHGPKPTDTHLLHLLSSHGIPHSIVLSKVDRILLPHGPKKRLPSPSALEYHFSSLRRVMEDMRVLLKDMKREGGWGPGNEGGGEILACSGEVALGGRKLGVSAVRWAILRAAGLGSGGEAQRIDSTRNRAQHTQEFL
ncbi:MAG: GTP-binding protein [Geoglossum umbratile]|nr:MAG: GTP-binding protein [Geoglossum umbratile]